MKKITLNVIGTTVIENETGSDRIILMYEGKSQFPSWLDDLIPVLTITVEHKHGKEYIENLCGVSPIVIERV